MSVKIVTPCVFLFFGFDPSLVGPFTLGYRRCCCRSEDRRFFIIMQKVLGARVQN